MKEELNMLDRYKKTIRNNYIWATYVLSILMECFLFYFNWMIGFAFLILLAVFVYANSRETQRIEENKLDYICKLTSQVKNVIQYVFWHMPIGIVIYDDDYAIKWANPYVSKLLEMDSLAENSLDILSEQFIPAIKSEKEEVWLTINHCQLRTKIDLINQTLVLFDRTEEKRLEKQFLDEELVLATIYLDNYEEISRNMSDNMKTQLISMVTAKLNKWAEDYQFYLKRTSQDRFIGVLTKKTLGLLEKSRFEILDEIR